MARRNETEAAKIFMNELSGGRIPVERCGNTGNDYCLETEPDDTAAVRAFTKSELFMKIKNM